MVNAIQISPATIVKKETSTRKCGIRYSNTKYGKSNIQCSNCLEVLPPPCFRI
jgi:hypothetical protein